MSRINGLKILFPVFAIAILVLSVAIPALAGAKVQSNDASGSGQAIPTIKPVTGKPSPVVSLVPGGNSSINVTPDTPSKPGNGRLGNIRTPPAIVSNLTQTIKTVVNDARLNQARRIAESKTTLIISQLQLYEKWVAGSSLGDDQKSDIKAVVDDNIAWFRQMEDQIQAAGDTAAVQALTDQIDQQADMLKVNIKKEAGIMACDRLDDRIDTARNASAGIAEKITALKTRADDTARIEQKLADCDEHVNTASSYSLAARTAFEGITSADNSESGFSEGTRQIGLADREMNQAYADLKAVYLWYLQAIR